MATAKDNPTLVIDIEFNDKDAKKRSDAYFKEEQRKAQSFSDEQKRTAQKTEADVTAIKSKEQAKALAQKQRLETLAQAKLSAQAQAGELKKEQTISLMQAKELERRRIAYERQMERIAAGHTTWSQKMVKGINGIGMSIKGLALAWAAAFVGQNVRNAINFAGSLEEQASGIRVTAAEYFALTSAMRDAGAGAERLEQIFAKLNNIVGGGASDQERKALTNLGIASPESLSNIQLLDKMIQRVNSGLANQSDIAEIFGNRAVAAFNRVASSFSSFDQISREYKFPLTKEEIARLDAFNDKLEQAGVNLQLLVAKTIGFATESNNIYSIAPVWVSPYIKALEEVADRQDKVRSTASRFGALMAGAQSDIEARRNFAANGPFSLPEQVVSPGRLSEPAPFISPIYGANIPRIEATPISGLLSGVKPVVEEITDEYVGWEFQAQKVAVSHMSIRQYMQSIASSGAWQVAQQGAQSLNSVLSLQAQLLQNEITSLDMVQERERRRWQERSDSLRTAGLENSALYRNEQRMFEQAEKVREAKANQLKSKAFEQEKLGRYAQTTMNMATGIVNAWTTPGAAWIAPVLVGLIAATGAAQLATIEAQKNPYHFREGGFVSGDASDNNRVRATGGEFMVEKNSAARNADALRFMNSGGTMQAGGGSVTVIVQGNVVQNDEWIRDSVIPSILKAQRSGVRVFR